MKLQMESGNLDWTKLWIIVGTVIVMWSSLATVIPEPYYKITMTILSALQAGVTFALRSGKYVETRQEVPRQGEQP